MSNYFHRIIQGLSIIGILTARLPIILMDGKVTVDELSSLTKDICLVMGWKVSMTVPADIQKNVIGVTGDMD